jgi:general secretion pathway protein M
MAKLPAKGQGKLLAIGLLLLVGLLAYGIGFAGFFAHQGQLNEELDGLAVQLANFRRAAGERDRLKAELDQVKSQDQTSALFMTEENFDLGAATLDSRLKQVVAQRARDTQRCQVTSSSTRRPLEPERFEKVTVSVRMRCDLEDLIAVFHELESGVPVLFLENVNIFYEQAAYMGNQPGIGYLDVRFDLSGYLRVPSTVKK